MTGRLFAALVWLPVLLLPTLRRGLAAVAAFLWPSRLLGDGLTATPAPSIIVVAIGFVVTAWLAGHAIRLLRRQADADDPLFRPHGGDAIAAIGLLVTLAWLVLTIVVAKLELPLAGAAVLVLVGLIGGREPVVLPAPSPAPSPRPLPPLPRPRPEEEEEEGDKGTLERSFTWLFNEEPFRKAGREHSFSASLTVPRSLYEAFRGRSHAVVGDASYIEFVNAELDDEVVMALASRLRQLGVEHGFDRLTEIHLAMAFTLSIVYASDEAEYGREYPKYPVETTVDQRGDCEDHAILCGAVLHGLGHRCGLVLMETGGGGGHAALVVEAPAPVDGVSFRVRQIGTEMFYCEVTPGQVTTKTTTAVQWWLGMAPPGDARNFKVFPIGTATGMQGVDQPRRLA